jgi:hypothetical protein
VSSKPASTQASEGTQASEPDPYAPAPRDPDVPDDDERNPYDKAKWHFETETREELPEEMTDRQYYVPGGTVLAWFYFHRLCSRDFIEQNADELRRLRSREWTPAELYEVIDGVLDAPMLTRAGAAFADTLFTTDDTSFYHTYSKVLGAELPSDYQVPDSWETYDRVAALLDERYRNWLETKPRKKRMKE